MKNLSKYLAGALLIFFSCEKIENLLTFDVKDSTEFTIPSFTGINSPLSIPVPPVRSSSNQAFENNNTNANLVKDVSLKKLNLQIIAPEEKSFKFLKSVEIYISAEGEEEIMLASKYDIPTAIGNSLDLETTNHKLDAYIKKDSYDIRTVVEVREIPGQDVTVKADMTFKVTADPL